MGYRVRDLSKFGGLVGAYRFQVGAGVSGISEPAPSSWHARGPSDLSGLTVLRFGFSSHSVVVADCHTNLPAGK